MVFQVHSQKIDITADISAAKKRIEKRKELEGIDSGNVILEPRSRRAAAAAPKYDESESDEEEEEDGEEEENEDGEDGEDGEAPGTIGTPSHPDNENLLGHHHSTTNSRMW